MFQCPDGPENKFCAVLFLTCFFQTFTVCISINLVAVCYLLLFVEYYAHTRWLTLSSFTPSGSIVLNLNCWSTVSFYRVDLVFIALGEWINTLIRQILSRDEALRATEQQIRSMEMKLNSAFSAHQKEKEAWEINLHNVEETWRCNLNFMYCQLFSFQTDISFKILFCSEMWCI